MFHPGQPVVCVDDAFTNVFGTNEIVCGRTYTVRAVVEPDPLMSKLFGRPLDEPGVLLVEVRREVDPEYGEWPFGAYRFRPLDQTEYGVETAERVPA